MLDTLVNRPSVDRNDHIDEVSFIVRSIRGVE